MLAASRYLKMPSSYRVNKAKALPSVGTRLTISETKLFRLHVILTQLVLFTQIGRHLVVYTAYV